MRGQYTCEWCGASFEAWENRHRRFCSRPCSDTARTKTVEQRFWPKVDKRQDGCWVWQAATLKGYGQFNVGHRICYAHRVAYELVVGPIPDGLELDHLCRNTLCVNPDHLEPVTMRVNILRSQSEPANNARKTHCPHGHAYDAENTYVNPKGHRSCRECRRIRWRTYLPPKKRRLLDKVG